MEMKQIFFCILILFSIISFSTSDPSCVYTVYVKTGSTYLSGTDSKVSATLYTASGAGITITNLVEWGGVPGNGGSYFKTGSLDAFTGTGPCLGGPVCAVNLTSDGSGCSPSWNVNSLEVAVAGWGQQCAKLTVSINQWLAQYAYPYSLSAFRNNCNSKGGNGFALGGGDKPPTVYVV